jgi:hypothetical protein
VRPQPAFLLLSVLTASCGNNLGPPSNLTGAWAASYQIPGPGLVLNLAQPDGTITGSGTYQVEAGPSGTLRISGSYVRPHVRLALRYDLRSTRNYDGAVLDSHQMIGTESDSTGYTGSLTLIRR